MRYRLERVRELSGLDVGSTDGREKLSLGLKAMRVLGIAAPGGPARGRRGRGATRDARGRRRRRAPLGSAAMRIGILTGSGTYALPGLEAATAAEVATRFGAGTGHHGAFAGVDVLHVSRHREGHELLSRQVTHQANIAALERARRATRSLAVTVCGALRPGARARHAASCSTTCTSSPTGCPTARSARCTPSPGEPGRGHWIFDRPFSQPLREALLAGGARGRPSACATAAATGTSTGRASTRETEIRMLQRGGRDGGRRQTAGPETVLCGEAEIPYALLGYATDYANGVSPRSRRRSRSSSA